MDKYIDNYNDSKKVTYHEQTDISNILKLRAVLKKDSDIIRIGNSCFGSSKRIHSTKIILPLRTIP